MAVTYSGALFNVSQVAMTAPTPSGAGGMVVVFAAYCGTSPTPQTSVDWTLIADQATWNEAGVKAYYSVASSPDMVFLRTGTNTEAGLHSFRISDAKTSTPNVKFAAASSGGFVSSENLPDAATAPDGVALVGVGMQTSTVTATSLGFTADYSGDIGSEGWFARDCFVGHLDSVTPGGGTFDAGTATFAGSCLANMITVVVEVDSTPAPQTWTGSTATVAVDGVSGEFSTPHPTIKSSNTQAGTSLSGASNFTLPSGAATGDLVLYFVSCDNTSTTAISASTGWATVDAQIITSNVHRASVFARVLTGTGGDNILNPNGAAQDYTCIGVCIDATQHPFTTSTDLTSALFDAGTFSASNGSANPPNSNPGTSDDYLWLTYACIDKSAAGNSITAPPTNFTSIATSDSAASNSSSFAMLAQRRTTASSQDPGTFTNTSRPWIAFTLAISPPASGDQTWTGSTATVLMSGVSGAFVADQTWAGSTATITATGVSGTFTAAATWPGSTATIVAAGVSGTFSAGTATWSGSTGTAALTGVSGEFGPGAVSWAGSTATISADGVSGIFTAGPVTWTGSTASISIEGVSGEFAGATGPQTWTGSAGNITVTAVSGELLAGSVTWPGSNATATVTGASGTFSPGTALWSGSVGSAAISGISGTFSASTTWTGSSGSINAAGISGAFTPGEVDWQGSTATATFTATSGEFTPGAAAWTGTPGLVVIEGVSGEFGAPSNGPSITGDLALVDLTVARSATNLAVARDLADLTSTRSLADLTSARTVTEIL